MSFLHKARWPAVATAGVVIWSAWHRTDIVIGLVKDSREIKVDVALPRPWVASAFGPIDVPDDATALVDGLAAYGA